MASLKVILYTQKTLKDGSSPIMIVFSHDYQRKRFSLGVSCVKENWDKEMSQLKSNFPNYKKFNRLIQKTLFKAEDIVTDLKGSGLQFTVKDFEEKYLGVKAKDAFQFFDDYISRLISTGKVGNAAAYKDARNAIKKFHSKDSLRFTEINYAYLIKFEEHLRMRGAADTTIRVYMRTLRALFNKAIKEKLCSQESYPFKEYQISKLKGETIKKAISKEEMKSIHSFIPDSNTKQELSKHIFLFSFYTQGMNFIDIVKLKWVHVKNDRISYQRSKTGKIFSIKVLPPVKEILNFYRETNSKNPYIFPVLDATYKTPTDIRNRAKHGLKRLNIHLKFIGEQLKIDKPLTSYVARHSYATILKKSGVSTSVISEGLGHQDERTTQIYLDSFDSETLDRANEFLL